MTAHHVRRVVRASMPALFALLGSSVALAADGVPPKAVTFFNAVSCPAGWTAAALASGRLLLATTDPAKVGSNLGKPLVNAEDRVHKHDYKTEVDVNSRSISAADSCCNSNAARAKKYEVKGTTDSAASGLPFVQLAVCERLTSPADPAVSKTGGSP